MFFKNSAGLKTVKCHGFSVNRMGAVSRKAENMSGNGSCLKSKPVPGGRAQKAQQIAFLWSRGVELGKSPSGRKGRGNDVRAGRFPL